MRVGESKTGRGVFATEPMVTGQPLGRIDGRVVLGTVVTVDHFDLEYRGLVLVPRAPFRYLNHSCEPNGAVTRVERTRRRPLLSLDAIRDIAAGEEVTIDYGFSAEDAFPCACGSARCRGWVASEVELGRLSSVVLDRR